MTEVPEIKTQTPGQALYAVIAERFVDDDDITDWSAWDELEESARQVYEDAAQAGTDARIAAILKAADGSTVIVAFNHPLTAKEANELHLRWADYGPEPVEIVIVEDVAAIAVREPAPDLVDKSTRDHADVGLPGEVRRANANRAAAGLELLPVPGEDASGEDAAGEGGVLFPAGCDPDAADDDFVQDRRADLDPNAGEADPQVWGSA